jgi:hypothetical protein
VKEILFVLLADARGVQEMEQNVDVNDIYGMCYQNRFS